MSEKVLGEWGSRRRVDFLTPDTFTRKIIVVSTTMNNNGGETAIMQMYALNYFEFDYKLLSSGKNWKILKRHKNAKNAIVFHENFVNKLKFSDAEEIKAGEKK